MAAPCKKVGDPVSILGALKADGSRLYCGTGRIVQGAGKTHPFMEGGVNHCYVEVTTTTGNVCDPALVVGRTIKIKCDRLGEHVGGARRNNRSKKNRSQRNRKNNRNNKSRKQRA